MFEKILRMAGNSDIHFEIKKDGYSIRLRNIKDGISSENELIPHSQEFYNDLESYIEAPKDSIMNYLLESSEVILIESKNIPNKMIRVACMPFCPLGNGCSIVIRLK
jgi:hypothetical protein